MVNNASRDLMQTTDTICVVISTHIFQGDDLAMLVYSKMFILLCWKLLDTYVLT